MLERLERKLGRFALPNVTRYLIVGQVALYVLSHSGAVSIESVALITWIGYGLAVITGSWQVHLLVMASVSKFFLFFARDLQRRVRSGHRRMAREARQESKDMQPFHQCTVCGVTDKTHPRMDFRYCSGCHPNLCYCREHVKGHDHVVPA